MAYTDGVQLYTALVSQVETAAAVCIWMDRTGEAATAALQMVTCPNGATIEEWGYLVCEALTNANATKAVLTLQKSTLQGAAVAAAGTMTVPASVADITLANGSPGSTTTTLCAIGARHISTSGPIEIPPGGHFYFEITTAAGAAGGSIQPFAVVRHGASASATAASAVYKLAS